MRLPHTVEKYEKCSSVPVFSCLWQSRYYSCPVAPERLGAVMRYVELNPVRAGLAAEAVDYR